LITSWWTTRLKSGDLTVSAASHLDEVRSALERPRPGLPAQLRLSPRPRNPGITHEEAPRPGGVLLLLYPHEQQLHLVLTRRADTLSNHKGQVSLPGGQRDPGETPEITALRELHEELGIEPNQVDVLGRLTPLYIPPSNYCIYPVVGYAAKRPRFRPNPAEVADVLEVPVAALLDPDAVHEEEWSLRDEAVQVPFFAVAGHKVWGATAMVLAEFVELLHGTQRDDTDPGAVSTEAARWPCPPG
jgi:8-oxo-dGTP pyrophosphatase MutT (NUDIX family)